MSDVQEAAERRARPLVVMLVLAALLVAASIWRVFDYFSTRNPFDRGGSTLGWLLLMVAAWLGTAVLWIAWFQVLHEGVVDARRARFTRSAWLWAWLIPGANIVVPKMLVNDVWRAGDEPGAPPSSPPWPVQVWWALWVLLELAEPLGRVFGVLDADIGPRVAAVAMGAFFVVEAILAVATVRVLTRRAGEMVPALPPQAAPVLA